MNILSTVLILFLVLETLNVFLLYFTPESKRGNALGVFDAYEKSKEHPEIHALINYLINWVAGTKLIFIVLLIVVLITGSPATIYCSVIVLIFSILTFYWRLFPAIKMMDKSNQITPKGYSKTLGIMIAVFVLVFLVALIFSPSPI